MFGLSGKLPVLLIFAKYSHVIPYVIHVVGGGFPASHVDGASHSLF